MKIQKADIEGTKALLVDGIVQSTYPPCKGGYWRHMIPKNFKGKDILILGLGAGTIARLLLEAYPHVKITGVDNSSLVINAANRDFGLMNLDIEIVIEDGFAYIERTKKKFDLIIVDMWNGYWFPIKVLSQEFIKKCNKHLREGGQVFINAPSLDFLAQEGLKGQEALRDDIERNIIYRWKLTK